MRDGDRAVRGKGFNMPKASFIVVTDRGTVKAFELQQTPNHGLAARLVMEKKLQEAHERCRDRFTDQAGAFPSDGSNGHGNAVAERPKMATEEDNRLFKAIAREVDRVIREYQPLSWSFAAPAEINSAILQYVPADLHRTLKQNVKRNLARIPCAQLAGHFPVYS
jgi:hypothetical protein